MARRPYRGRDKKSYPLRRVVETWVDSETGVEWERLECGHELRRRQDAYGPTRPDRRRCRFCYQHKRKS